MERGASVLEEPFAPALACVRVLRANGDPRWRDLLERAHARLEDRASRLSDEAGRPTFLTNVPPNRELVAEWQRAGATVPTGLS